MKPPRFAYERPESLAEALELLDAYGDRAKVLAGGQSLVALMNLRLASPEVIVDVGRLDELRYIRRDQGELDVGALTTHATVQRDASVTNDCPLLAEAVGYIGHAAIRNRGTIGGSIAHADPAAELPIVLIALGGSVTATSSAGSRRIAAEDLFESFLMTTVKPNEIVTEVSFPVDGAQAGVAFEEFARRPGDFALVSVACRIYQNGDGLASARIVLGGVSYVPQVVAGLDGLPGDDERVVTAVAEAIAGVTPTGDIHGSSEYRQHLVRRLTERAVRRALTGRK